MDVSGGSTADGAPVIQWSYSGGNNQKWQLIGAGSGNFHLVNNNSGKVLDVPNGSITDGTGLVQATGGSGSSQKRQFVMLP